MRCAASRFDWLCCLVLVLAAAFPTLPAFGQSGAISGKVVNSSSGEPLPFAKVRLENEDGSEQREALVDSQGKWQCAGLPPGIYLAIASEPDHQSEIYDGIPCPTDCDLPDAGTPIVLADGASVENVDFALAKLGAISGTIRAAETLELLAAGWVEIFDGQGRSVGTGSGGNFTAGGLHAGVHFVVAQETTNQYRVELWQGRFCIDSDCQPYVLSGTPVMVSLGQTTGGIDFVLEKWPRIEGRVVASGAGSPLANIEVFAIKLGSSSFMYLTRTDAQGFYRFRMLDPSTYSIVVFATDDYYQEVWDGVTCGVDDCDWTAVGQAVTLGFGESATGIDFALEPRNTFFRDGFESGDLGAWSEVQRNDR